MMAIDRWETPHSSNVAEVTFDPDTREMTVRFKSGGTYTHGGVDAATAEALATDPSPGSFYSRNIRNRYTARKL